MSKTKLPSLSRIKKALYADWSLRVRARDGFKCLLCGATENLTAHHWYCADHWAHVARYAIANGATLCYACHIRGIHSRADYVSVMKLRRALGTSTDDILGMDTLIGTELTTALLRELWDAMRRRPIVNMGMHLTIRGGKIFLFTAGHQIAVVGNVIRIPQGQFYAGDYDVAVVTSTQDGYRYTLKKLETEAFGPDQKIVADYIKGMLKKSKAAERLTKNPTSWIHDPDVLAGIPEDPV